MYVIGIDPGTTHLGVCVYDAHQDQVKHLCDFNLASYLPTTADKGMSCFSTTSVVTTNIGRCILNMVKAHPRIFLPEDVPFRVVVEKQMNENPNNCCVLTAIQSIYALAEVDCAILDPSRLRSCFPHVFHGTSGNRSLRKKRITTFGAQLLRTLERTRSSQYQFNRVEPLGPSFDPGKKRKRKKPTVHALDGMFYAFASCVMDDSNQTNPVDTRVQESSTTQDMLREAMGVKRKEPSIRRFYRPKKKRA